MEPVDGQALVGHTDVPSVFSVRVICSLVVLLFFFVVCVSSSSVSWRRDRTHPHTHTQTHNLERRMAS